MPNKTRGTRGAPRSRQPLPTPDPDPDQLPWWRRRGLLLVALASNAFFAVVFVSVLTRSGCGGMTGEQLRVCQARGSVNDGAALVLLAVFLVLANVSFAVLYLSRRRRSSRESQQRATRRKSSS
jgi:hypothetical protein